MKVNNPNIKCREVKLLKKLIDAANYISSKERRNIPTYINLYQDPNKK